jgi:hypothetical protein
MKRIFILTVMMAMVLGVSMQAHATLFNQGTDTLGNRLIYDNDLDITWYDYTRSYDTWQNQVNWADALSVTFGGNFIDNWRLPTALNQDGSGPCSGYNCTGSEMGHLYYTELGNAAGGPLTNTGPFTNLQQLYYWSGTEYSADPHYAWDFDTNGGNQTNYDKGLSLYAIAVRPGDVSAVPEPGTMLLLGTGLAGLIVFRKRPGRIHG